MSAKRETISAFAEIMKFPGLTPEEKVLWGLYRAYDYRGRGAWPGDDTLADHMDVSTRTVQRARAKLLRLGYLTQTLRGPRPALYQAVVPNAPPLPPSPRRNGRPEPLADSHEEMVRILEIMSRKHYKEESWPDEYDVFRDLWEQIPDRIYNGIVSVRPDVVTEARGELHKFVNSYDRGPQ